MNNHEKHTLGRRALFLFLMKRIKFALFLFALTFAVWYAERWLPAQYAGWGSYIFELTLILLSRLRVDGVGHLL